MPYFLDGYNFIFQNETLKELMEQRGAEAARNELVGFIATFNSASREKAVVVFDGGPLESASPRKQDLQGVEVIFSKKKGGADARLIEIAENSKKRGTVTVVTDDGGIRRESKRLKASIMSCAEFTALAGKTFARAEKKIREALPREKYDGLNARDVERWMEIFGFKDEE